jgi:hypothetical protein
MPDGDYKVHGFEEHGPLGGKLSGLGNWSSFIGPGSGNIGKRTGLMLHNDIDPLGTLGCIGVGLGGKAGGKADKEFVKSYKLANPEKIMVKLVVLLVEVQAVLVVVLLLLHLLFRVVKVVLVMIQVNLKHCSHL